MSTSGVLSNCDIRLLFEYTGVTMEGGSEMRTSSTLVRASLVQRLRQLWDSIRMTVIVIGTAAVVFASARNTITWYFQRFWGASGFFWQNRWEWIHDQFGGDDFALTMMGTAIVTNLVFWAGNIPLMLIDVYGWPQALLKYKIQEDKNVPIDMNKLKKAILVALFNQSVVAAPVICITYHIMKWRGADFGVELPTFHWVMFEVMVFSLVEELFFYYGHRMFHTPTLYKRFHKMHHEWAAPIGITSVYAHPLEHVLCNLMPTIMGPILMGSHIATMWLWFVLALLSTTVSHSGYHLPLLPSPEAHDYHHSRFNNNFGVLGVLDRLHGTDTNFRATKAYQRHFLLLSLVPVSQQVPDNPCYNAKSE